MSELVEKIEHKVLKQVLVISINLLLTIICLGNLGVLQGCTLQYLSSCVLMILYQGQMPTTSRVSIKADHPTKEDMFVITGYTVNVTNVIKP